MSLSTKQQNMEKRRSRLISMVMIMSLLVTTSSCRNEEPHLEVPALGGTYRGGIVFYLDTTGKHGLTASLNDQSTTYPWWNGSKVYTGATSVTNGLENTASIIAALGNSGVFSSYAANFCRNYRGGGFTDWFLPSKDQLNMLYSKKTIVGGFTSDLYWTSTEASIESAWVQSFENGDQFIHSQSDGDNIHTRAIRAF